jgi:hypothetical protein
MNINKDKSYSNKNRTKRIRDNKIKYMCTYMLLVLYDEFFYYKKPHNNNITTRNEIYQRPNEHSYINPLLLTNNKGVLFNTPLLQSQPNTSINSQPHNKYVNVNTRKSYSAKNNRVLGNSTTKNVNPSVKPVNPSVNTVKIAPLSGGPMFQNNNRYILQTQESVY